MRPPDGIIEQAGHAVSGPKAADDHAVTCAQPYKPHPDPAARMRSGVTPVNGVLSMPQSPHACRGIVRSNLGYTDTDDMYGRRY
jgi:hypothetical protein